ncbi:hypothetical protein [Luteolibacter sp. Populi]|uniref:hypothetical protein n=1 Tax=Luteolibacter sp. Populi TaxID=3230487 RepID=UPI003466EA76
MADAFSSLSPNHKLEMSILELAPSTDWPPPEAGTLDHAALQFLLADVNGRAGVELVAMPSVTARSGEATTIEMIRELIVPTDEAGPNFETHNLGRVIKLSPEPLGLGQQAQLNYSNTTGGLDPVSLRAAVEKQEIDGSGFIREGGTRVAIETRPDGSRTVVLTTPTLIDATGMPLREADR